MTTLWLRTETKAFEHRTALTPEGAQKLIALGAKIYVEKDPERVFSENEYQKVGCIIVEAGSWKEAPKKTIILGLKELEEEELELKHRHIYFAHAYKGQTGAADLLKRFLQGGGTLYDLEYLTDQNQRRIAAFGKWAGFVGAALALDIYNQEDSEYKNVTPFKNQTVLIDKLKSELKNKDLSAIIIGAKGRCGSGARELLEASGIKNITLWDYEETKKGGPFPEIIDHDIFVNCVLVQKKIPPFFNNELLLKNEKLRVIADVSCDPTSPFNPIPVYDHITTPKDPVIKLRGNVDLMAIDLLPSLLPLESSLDFAAQLFPHLEALVLSDMKNEMEPLVWHNSKKVYLEHIRSVS